MKTILQQAVALFLCDLLLVAPFFGCAPRTAAQPVQPSGPGNSELRDQLQKGYVDLFDLAPRVEFSATEIAALREALKSGREFCVARFKDHAKLYSKQLEDAQKSLKAKTGSISDSERSQFHCQIQNLDLLKSEAEALSGHAIPTAYENLNAKLDIIEKWPAQHQLIQQELDTGAYNARRWGDVKDIGFREIEPNQQEDIKKGQDAIDEMKRTGLLPPEVEDKAVISYVDSVAQRIAKASDLKVPLHITVLQSREINAFALPGGYLFLQRGLLEATDNESELAGVVAHEISHDVARHSNKLMKRATVASLFYQAAQIAATILTGGAAGVGLYYALQYGFYGLGLVIDLKLLGVSRDYELEADQLGVQYAWNAGYDPSGFIQFFDKMATKEGYVNGASWFRTHPPFFERMVATEREIAFLPPKPNPTIQTPEFEAMKKALAPITAAAEKEEVGKPSLKLPQEAGCAPPQRLEYTADQPIEQICSKPPVTVTGLNPNQ
jgi:Zn-dependent protease with chaperone function